jgi:hypothetical protein
MSNCGSHGTFPHFSPSSNEGPASHAAELSEAAQHEQQEMQVQQDRAQQPLHHQQVCRIRRDQQILKQRRNRKIRRRLPKTSEDGPEPMEYEWLTEHSDQDMYDQGRSSELLMQILQ